MITACCEQVSRRLARRLGTELRGRQAGYVHLIAATYAALVRELDARDGALLAKELVVQPVVRLSGSRPRANPSSLEESVCAPRVSASELAEGDHDRLTPCRWSGTSPARRNRSTVTERYTKQRNLWCMGFNRLWGDLTRHIEL